VWGQTGHQAKAELIEQLGAERAVVAGPEELLTALDGLEPTVAFDPLGGGFVEPVVEALSPGGRIVSFGTSAAPEVEFNMRSLYRKGLSLLGYGGMLVTPELRREGLRAAFEALRAGELKFVVDEVLPLDRVNDAFRRLAERSVSGKLMLDLR